MRTPCALILGFLSLGILLAGETGIPIAAGAVIMAAAIAFWTLAKNRRQWGVFVMFLGIGIICADIHKPTPLDFENEIYSPLARGRVENVAEKVLGQRMEVSLSSLTDRTGNENVPVRNIKVYLTCSDKTFKTGDDILFFHQLKPITPDLNHRGSEKWTELLRHKGILYRQNVKGDEIMLTGHTRTLAAMSTEVRDFLAMKLECSRLQTSTKRFLVTVLLGDSEVLSQEEREEFSNAGIAHILALSGMHVAIVAGLLLWLFAPLNIVLNYKWRYVITLFALWGYAFITGMSPSVVRASVMATFVFIAIILQRNNNSINSLCAAIIIILLISPSSLYNPGLLMSFFSVVAILIFAQQITPPDIILGNKLLSGTFRLLMVSLIAVGGTWVLTSYYFGKVPMLFLPLNMLVVPVLPFYVAIALLHTFLLSIGAEMNIISYLLDWGKTGLDYFVDVINNKGMTLNFEASLIGVFIWSATLLMLTKATKLKHRRYLVPGLMVIGIAGVIFTVPQKEDMMIIRNYQGDLNVGLYSGSVEEEMVMPQNKTTENMALGKRIIFVDEKGLGKEKKVCDILVVGRGYKGKIKELLQRYTPEAIIIGPGTYPSRADAIRQDCDNIGLPVSETPFRLTLPANIR